MSRRQPRPPSVLERVPSRSHGRVDVLGVAGGHRRQDRAVPRAHRVEGGSRPGGDESAVDERLRAEGEFGRRFLPVLQGRDRSRVGRHPPEGAQPGLGVEGPDQHGQGLAEALVAEVGEARLGPGLGQQVVIARQAPAGHGLDSRRHLENVRGQLRGRKVLDADVGRARHAAILPGERGGRLAPVELVQLPFPTTRQISGAPP